MTVSRLVVLRDQAARVRFEDHLARISTSYTVTPLNSRRVMRVDAEVPIDGLPAWRAITYEAQIGRDI